MNTEEKLAGYASTMDFVNELKKYIKITRVCDSDNITKCFDKEVIWNDGEEPVPMEGITDASAFGLDWETETVAVQFANGVNAVIAYNPNTTQDPYNNQFSATSNSMAILYDVSGNKNPNTNGKDINHINVTELEGVAGCMIPELKDTMCITQILGPDTGYAPLTKAECEEIADQGYGNNKANCGGMSTDYWAGAVKACGGTQNMPTQTQLEQLAAYIYPDASEIKGGDGDVTNSDWNQERATMFTAQSPLGNSMFAVWAEEEATDILAGYRFFDYASTNNGKNLRKFDGYLAVCIAQ